MDSTYIGFGLEQEKFISDNIKLGWKLSSVRLVQKCTTDDICDAMEIRFYSLDPNGEKRSFTAVIE